MLADRIVFEFTAEQQAAISRASGVRKQRLSLNPLELAELVLAAAHQGSETLVVARSPAMRARLLSSGSDQPAGTATLQLTEEQQALIATLTRQRISRLRVACTEWSVTYREDWESPRFPLRVGRRFLIAGEHTPIVAGADDLVLRLPESGRSEEIEVFGTGAHETTQLPLALLEEFVHARDRALDVGTGSGILAVAAVLLGAAHVDAVDIEPSAIGVARRTAELNQCSAAVSVREGSIGAADPPYDLVIANIHSNGLTTLAAGLVAAAASGGRLILSGIPASLAGSVRGVFTQSGCVLIAERSLGSWTAFAMRGPNA